MATASTNNNKKEERIEYFKSLSIGSITGKQDELTEFVENKEKNPETGKKIKIPAKKVVKFKAGKQLTDKVTKPK